MRKSIRKNIVVCIICVFFAILVLFIGFVVSELSNTKGIVDPTEIEATVVDVVEKDNDYLVAIEEYDCKLFIKSNSVIDTETLIGLNYGDKILFRLIELGENPLENSQIEQIFVVTLRTKTQDIITLESYYKSEEQGIVNIKIICGIVAIILGSIALFNLLKIVNKKRNN